MHSSFPLSSIPASPLPASACTSKSNITFNNSIHSFIRSLYIACLRSLSSSLQFSPQFDLQSDFLPVATSSSACPGSMGGCVSRPREPTEPKGLAANACSEPAVTAKFVDRDASSDQVKAETTENKPATSTTTEITEEPLVDLSEPEPVQETSVERNNVEDLVPELSELKADAPHAVEPVAVEAVTVSGEEEEKAVDEIAEEAKGPKAVADGKKEEEERVSP